MKQLHSLEDSETTAEQFCEQLSQDGWREYPDQFKKDFRCFYKHFETPTRCFCNDDKPGVQIQIAVGTFREFVSMELELCAGLKDETWIKICNYALPNTVPGVIALIPRLLLMWESANL